MSEDTYLSDIRPSACKDLIMFKNNALTFLLIAAALLLSGCGILPSIPAYTNHNQQILKSDSAGVSNIVEMKVDRASPSIAAQLDPHPHIFIGISISGGGSRAATFGTAVMSELDRLGFLEHAKVISSVSGGGLPAAYFALYGDQIKRPDDWSAIMSKMSQSFRSSLIVKQLLPHNLLLTAATDMDRSDLLAEVFDEKLFSGMKYSDLGLYKKRRPVLVANATEIGLIENRFFPFTNERFGAIGSRLDNFPISKAVVASAAFPGLLNSVTLKAWPPKKPDGILPEPYYIHLIDGGAIDNLGMTTLRAAARSYRMGSGDKDFKCLLFVIDAHPADPPKNSRTKRDLRSSPIDYIFDTNVYDGINALSVRRRYSDLDTAGIIIPDAAIFGAEPTYDPQWPHSSMNLEKFRYIGLAGEGGAAIGYDRVTEMPLSRKANMSIPQKPDSFFSPRKMVPAGSCIVWHISLNGIRSLDYSESDVPTKPGPEGERDYPPLVFRDRLWHLLTRVNTDFNLSGPKGCSRKLIEQSMFDAAKILVKEDRESLKKVCDWFNANIGASFERCLERPEPLLEKRLPVSITRSKTGEMSVLCTTED